MNIYTFWCISNIIYGIKHMNIHYLSLKDEYFA